MLWEQQVQSVAQGPGREAGRSTALAQRGQQGQGGKVDKREGTASWQGWRMQGTVGGGAGLGGLRH